MKTMMTGRNLARAGQLMAAVAAAATLAACGGGDAGSAPAPEPSAPAPAPTPGPTPAPEPPPTAGDLSSIVQPTSYAASSPKAFAYNALNAARILGGFGTVAQNTALDAEAQNQADFIAANYTVPNVIGGVSMNATALLALQPDGNETGHVQLSSLPGYTAYLPSDRAVHFGYPATNVAESAAFGNWMGEAGTQCVNELLASPGHRQILLDPRFRDVGLGLAVAGNFDATGTILATDCYIATAAESWNYGPIGMATAPAGWVGIFPADGSTVFSIDDAHGHGFAPSLTVDSQLTLTAGSFTLTDSTGNVVATTLNRDALSASSFQNWAILTPNALLQPSTTYTVNFQGAAGGTAITKTWKFTTPAN